MKFPFIFQIFQEFYLIQPSLTFRFGLGFVFFGFFQYMGKISEHVFMLFILSNICIIPGAIVSLFVALHASRKKTIVAGQLITGICFLLFYAFPKGVYVNDWPRIVLSSITIFLFAVSC